MVTASFSKAKIQSDFFKVGIEPPSERQRFVDVQQVLESLSCSPRPTRSTVGDSHLAVLWCVRKAWCTLCQRLSRQEPSQVVLVQSFGGLRVWGVGEMGLARDTNARRMR